ncbi:hypothetical protein ASG43_07835 [Aureimonas sp. Leaf454]|uniref:hypothetical protein n=1 Tax=Aureimonas sp. Leaf454 TaxID=1736381 RepID=UPI0006F7DFEA|nr:hypothetical protein [Aureimonas sp. Leaf454]KQT48756.1 hypothetical protein ASG43_07835 [Aureimonas sp. Leaf454]
MKIIAIRPAYAGAGKPLLAHFDVELHGSLRLYGLALRKTPDGRLRIIAPNANGKHAATFAPELADEITKAARVALSEGHPAYART